ncbi:trypsin-1-like [Oratosquilla oratoria]|uniref:trypsin-1-like n=1 Tax=Oratosquilla oratoria TaxID=337810 RepID=UPI003F7605EB
MKFLIIALVFVFVGSLTAEPKRNKAKQQPICSCQYKCGMPNRSGRVVGGSETARSEYPWMASLSYRGKLYCGASLVNNKYLVTAAHCIEGVNKDRVEIVLGAHNMTDPTDPRRQRRAVSQWWAHKGFNRKTYNNDIGIILLDKAVSLTNFVRPVCLPKKENRSYVGEMGTVTGWGRTKESGKSSPILRNVQVPIITNEECKKKNYRPDEIMSNMMCAGYDEGKIDACQGDSGGPLLFENKLDGGKSQIDIIGIVSWGLGCARSGYPGVYCRISYYRDFIDEHIKDGCFCPRD